MFYTLLITGATILSSIIYFKPIINTFRHNYTQFKRLNDASEKVIKFKYKGKHKGKYKINKWKILRVTFETIFQKFYLSFLQYVNNSVKMLKMGIYEVNYVIGHKNYKMVIISHKGPCPILQINNENYEDITQLVLPYMGPNYDWHGCKFTPEFFGCHSMNFELSNGETFVYEKNEDIISIKL